VASRAVQSANLFCALLVLAGCSSSSEVLDSPALQTASTSTDAPASTGPARSTTTDSTTTTPPAPTTSLPIRLGSPPPGWLGSRVLPLRPDEDNGVAQPTPVELTDRRLWTDDALPPPPSDVFESEVSAPVPASVLARSTWREECPVSLDDLAYAQVSFYGFDGLFHTGELIIQRDVVDDLVRVFEELHQMRFPIEEMRVTTQEAVDAPPTGDSNNTSSFVCRPAVNSGTWSRHAHGGAIDVNPFHNPYVKGDLVIPELASAYLDRERELPGMITPEIEVLFADFDWGWGGNWNSSNDWMHFSDTGG
jgi:hypothetical protein